MSEPSIMYLLLQVGPGLAAMGGVVLFGGAAAWITSRREKREAERPAASCKNNTGPVPNP